jgi:hypothetical protein
MELGKAQSKPKKNVRVLWCNTLSSLPAKVDPPTSAFASATDEVFGNVGRSRFETAISMRRVPSLIQRKIGSAADERRFGKIERD